MSVSSLRSSKNELSCYLSAFQADDTLISIIPAFNNQKELPLLTTSTTTSTFMKAGIECTVPLWMAVYLSQKSLCTISLPDWLCKENLVKILEYERKEGTLWNNNDGTTSDSTDSIETTSTSRSLPFHYYEIAMRLTSQREGGGVVTDPSVQLLIQDILEVRLDKLRQQFIQLLSESSSGGGGGGNINADDDDNDDDDDTPNIVDNLMVSVNGIGSQELAILKSFVVQALNDQAYISNSNNNKTSSNNDTNDSGQQQQQQDEKAAAATTTTTGDRRSSGTDNNNDNNPPPPAAVRSRIPIRRFRS